MTSVRPTDRDLGAATSVGFVIRQVPRDGWGLTGALNWFNSDVDGAFVGVDQRIGDLRVQPFMGGAAYSIVRGRLATSFSIVAGPAFNRLRIDGAVTDRIAIDEPDSDNASRTVTLAVRPGVNASWALARRFAVVGFGGYLFNRPTFKVRTASGVTETPWRADALVLSVGAVFAVF